MNSIDGIEGFLQEFIEWYQGFLDGLMEYPWKEGESPLFKEREIQGARIKESTPLGLPYEDLGQWIADMYDRGNWEPLKQKETELAGHIKTMIAKYCVKGLPLIKIIGNSGYEQEGRTFWYPQYDVFIDTIQLRAGEHTILNAKMSFERAPFYDLRSLEGAEVKVKYWPSPILAGREKNQNNFWFGLESGDYLILIERDSKEALFERRLKSEREPPLLLFSVFPGQKGNWHPAPLIMPPDKLDGRLTAFLSNLGEGEQTHMYDKLIRI